jgi:hypothetical protein
MDEVKFGMEVNRLRVIRRWQVDNLVGKLLTHLDATFADPRQCKAQKDIVRQLTYNWFSDSTIEGMHEDQVREIVDNSLEAAFLKQYPVPATTTT